HMWRSLATTKPFCLQQSAEAQPDSPATSSVEGLLTEPHHALFARIVEACCVECSSCRAICLFRAGIRTFPTSSCLPASPALCASSRRAGAGQWVRGEWLYDIR